MVPPRWPTDATEEADESAPPLAVRTLPGTGTLISGSGGTQHEVPCPWCEGTGMTIPGHDAQAARRGDDDAGDLLRRARLIPRPRRR